MKPPPQNSNKDPNAQGGVNGRKTSISHGQGSAPFGLSSPASSSRPSTRRQQTSDSISGLASPGASRFSRDEPSPFFTRKFNESKDGQDDRAEDTKSSLPFGGLMRSNTAGSALGNGPASPWGRDGTMGTFGSFALGGSSANPIPTDKRPGLPTRESRLASLMPKESSEDISKAAERPWRPRQRTDTDPFSDEAPTGSAALGGGQDMSPPPNSQRRAPGLDTPMRGASSEFGMSDMPGFRDALQRGQSHQTPQARHDEHEPLSPSDTNPYRSPPDDRNDGDDESYDGESLQHSRVQGLGGLPEHAPNSFGNLPRGFANAAFDGSDRSQTSSAGASKGFPTLGGLSSIGGLGNMSSWPTSGNPTGTPDRDNRPGFSAPFGNSIFGPMGDLQSPGLGSLSGVFGQGPSGNLSGTGTAGRGSKLGSLFPAAMQLQMQNTDTENSIEGGDLRHSSAFGAIGRNAFPPSRDTDSPMRAGRHVFEDLFPPTDSSRNQGPFSTSDSAPGQTATSFSQAPSAQSNYQQSQASSDSASNQLPTAQQRVMVMPDRMRWVYLDPQGQVQGPWSGLEMHDWYKASFFTPDLSVKKLEDAEFEPLGQLIRRIGNSREPFLVPQIGIPHGPPTTQAGAPFTPAAAGPGNTSGQPGAVQPPFAGAFPSFGTTLTAEQQNNLERRKQEEQFLMARQREYLAQQQVSMKQMQMSGMPSALHHHSSAHSLQSQPSFGSMTSPIGIPPQPPIQGVSGFFDGPPRQVPPTQVGGGMGPDFFRAEDIARLSLQDRQQLFGAAAPSSQQPSQVQQIAATFSQHPETQRQAARMEQDDPQGFKARLREFDQLRAQHDLEEAAQASLNLSNDPIGPPQQPQQQQNYEDPPEPHQEEEPQPSVPEVLSLTQQVQKAASAKQSPIATAQPESAWAKVNTGLPMPFPPPRESSTPLPAPTAQRGRSTLPEALNVETRSRSETPEIAATTPSLAPWAKEPAEAPKGPSLKEIQEAEAKKMAKAEEIAAANRRAILEQEMKILASQPAAPAPGLPTSSTWGSGVSPATPTSAPLAWAKPANKTQITSANGSKKTLADIQREEELRKQKVAAATAAAQTSSGISGGKRYADLASKPTATSQPIGGSAWSTVGAGGKVRIPTGPAAVVPQTTRSVSSANIATAPAARASRPAPAIRSATTTAQSSINAANEEFTKWAKGELTRGLNTNINGKIGLCCFEVHLLIFHSRQLLQRPPRVPP
jgi:PERQ amino acid-rich with GYF domain-containing protein